MPVRVAALLRLSTKRQVQRQATPEEDIPGQKRTIEQFIASKPDWQLVEEYQEKGISAYKNTAEERSVLQQAIQDAAAGKWTALVVFKEDRLSRRGFGYLDVLNTFAELGVTVWSAAEGKLLSLEDEQLIVRSAEAYTANQESKKTSFRVRTNMRQMAEAGRWCGGRVPYGYQLVSAKDAKGEPVFKSGRVVRQLAPDPEKAMVIRRIFELCAAGSGTQAISGWLNAQGHPTATGVDWIVSEVRRILANPIYIGQLRYGRTKMEGRKQRKQPDSDVVLVPGSHEPLISDELWERARRVLESKRSLHPRQQSGTYIFSGILRCGVCGTLMSSDTWFWTIKRTGERKKTSGYRCRKWNDSKLCISTTYPEVELEAAFLDALEELYQPSGLIALLAEREREGRAAIHDAQEARKRTQEQLQIIQQALQRIDRAYFEAATLSDAEYGEKKAEYLARKRSLDQELATPVPDEVTPDFAALADATRDIRANWPYATAEERKTFVLNLMHAYGLVAQVYPDRKVVISVKQINQGAV